MEGQIGTLTGRVLRVVQQYPRAGPGEAIFTVYSQENKEWTCIIRQFCPVDVGDVIDCTCQLQTHPGYGRVLMLLRAPFVELAADRESILRMFLRTLRGTGFGVATANKLYDCMIDQEAREARANDRPLKDATVIHHMARLCALWRKYQDDKLFLPYSAYASSAQMKRLCSFWHTSRELRRLYLLGLSREEIEACHMPTEEIYDRCLKNPYVLVPVALEKCDDILARRGIQPDPEARDCGIITRKLYENMKNKAWTCTPMRVLRSLFPTVDAYLDRLQSEFQMKIDRELAYLPHAYRVETEVMDHIQDLIQQPPVHERSLKDEPGLLFQKTSLTDDQKTAVRMAMENNFSIVRGQAGTGKTVIIGELVHNLEHRDIPYAVASFTGKAVYRIKEVIRRDSPATLHRLIANARRTPPFRHLIIDEASMVTIELLWEFFNAFPGTPDPETGEPRAYAITLIGDPNQLEPISWGALFFQLIKSQAVPIVQLTVNHRLEQNSDGSENGIALNANAIADYDLDSDEPYIVQPTYNFQVVLGDIEQVFDVVKSLYQAGVPATDVTIVTPYNKELFTLNCTVQQIYDEGHATLRDRRGLTWALKDRIVCLKNIYDANLYNGSEGVVQDVKGAGAEETLNKSIVVKFKDGNTHEFLLNPRGEALPSEDEPPRRAPIKKKSAPQWIDGVLFDDPNEEDEATEMSVFQLDHAYALSVHKSQGSEWPYCIFFLPDNRANTSFLSRNLVYTAVTRAKRAIWIVTPNLETFVAAATRPPPFRCDGLAARMSTTLAPSDLPVAEGTTETVTI